MKDIFCLICRLITSDIQALCKMDIISKIGKKFRSLKNYLGGKRRKKDHTAQSHADDAQLYVSVGRSGFSTVRALSPLLYQDDYEELPVYGDNMKDEVVWDWTEVPSSTGTQQMSHADVGMASMYQAMGYDGYLPQGYQSK